MDVAGLYLMAARIDELADELRLRAERIGRHAAGLPWQSPAARAFDARLGESMTDVRAAALRVTGLADLVRRRAAELADHP